MTPLENHPLLTSVSRRFTMVFTGVSISTVTLKNRHGLFYYAESFNFKENLTDNQISLLKWKYNKVFYYIYFLKFCTYIEREFLWVTFQSNQHGRATKEENKRNCFILFFHWSLVLQKQFNLSYSLINY